VEIVRRGPGVPSGRRIGNIEHRPEVNVHLDSPPSHRSVASTSWLVRMSPSVPPDVQAYLDGIAPEHRAMWDRVDRLVRSIHPEAELRITYDMPTFVVGDRRLPVGVWKHGLSLYGLDETNDAGFIERHPDLSSGRGTVKLPTKRAHEFTDDELRATLTAVLGP
jgi:hypothetical protein